MNPDLETRRRLAAARLASARERVRVIRRRVAIGTASVFTAAWVGVFGQLISGQDPALGDGTKSTTARVSTTAHSTSAARATASAASTTASRTSAPTAQQTVAATPLTTRSS
ncbi:MAG: hypothetical protein QOJ01_1838 [Solirubrobacterales bacterium]|nr:hypothetical protein [Solirubrobacterales bacterium]